MRATGMNTEDTMRREQKQILVMHVRDMLSKKEKDAATCRVTSERQLKMK